MKLPSFQFPLLTPGGPAKPLALALALAPILPASAAFEKWINKDGKSASLELLGLTEKDGEKAANFKLPNGRTVVIKLSALAEVDAKRAAEGPRSGTAAAVSKVGKGIDPTKNVAPVIWLESLPLGAKDFLIGNVVWQQAKGLLWWSGGMTISPVRLGNSPDECLPALIRLNPSTGEVRTLTIPSGWGRSSTAKQTVAKGGPAVIDPWEAAVHVNGDRVVWHTGPLGVWEVDPERMELKSLVAKPGRVPEAITEHVNAGEFIGDAFCYIENDAGIRMPDDSFKWGARRVCCLHPGKPPIVLAETSRRPEVSPLDANDTEFCGLVAIDGLLWVLGNTEPVYHSRGIKAVGFPGGGLEGVKVVTDQRQVEGMVQTMKRSHLQNLPGLDKWLLGGGLSVVSSTKPGRLPVTGSAGQTQVPLELPVPKGVGGRYRVQEMKDDGSTGNEVEVDLDELANGGYTCPTIIGETDEVYFVMAATKRNLGNLRLPMLWTVSKDWLRKQAAQ